MSAFHDFMKTIEDDVKAEFTSAKSQLVSDAENLASTLKTDITPVAYAILQSAVAAAETAGGAWNVKLLAAVTTAAAQFAAKGIPVIINDIVAAITAIIASVNAEKAKLAGQLRCVANIITIAKDCADYLLTIFKEKIMSQLTDNMNAALANLESKLSAGGVTTDEVTAQIHTVVDPQIAALNTTIATITSSEADDATKIADLTEAVTEFTTAFAPATPTPAPAPGPGA